MKKEIANITEQLSRLERFAAEFPALEDGDPLVGFSAYGPFSIIFSCTDANRDSMLAAVGKILGRDGWTTSDDNSGKFLHWKATVSGVEITLLYAQPLDRPPQGFPVPPESFPLMIEDATH